MSHALASATAGNSHQNTESQVLSPGQPPPFYQGQPPHTIPLSWSACVHLKTGFSPKLHPLFLNLMALTLALVFYNPTLNTHVVTFQPLSVPRLSLALSSSSQVGESMLANPYARVFIDHDAVLTPSIPVLQIRYRLFSTPMLPDSFSSINKFG